jgi:GR25 family glycosyltransferase involved in LPS biosynthesis
MLEAHLAGLGLTAIYRRSAAVEWRDGQRASSPLSAGEIGCFASHLQLLERIAAEKRSAHVLEDDAVLSQWARPIIENLVSHPDLEGHDLVFTDTAVPLDLAHIARYSRLYSETVETDERGCARKVRKFVFLNLREVNFFCMSSYVVSATGAARLSDLLRADFERGPAYPVDISLRQHFFAGKLRATCLFPFTTGVRVGIAPAIEGRRRPTRTALALEFARHAFFLGADPSAADPAVMKALATPLDSRAQLLSRLLQFAAFGQDHEAI